MRHVHILTPPGRDRHMRCHRLAIIVSLAFSIVGTGSAVAQDSLAIAVTQLTDHIYKLSTDRGTYTDNTIASVGEDGVLLVDTDDDDAADALKRAVAHFGRGEPRFIVNTHVHAEHVGGNAAWGDGPVIIAHEIARKRMREGLFLFTEYPDEALPDITLTDSLSLHFNGERIRVIALPGAHDDHEVIVYFTGSKVAVVGPLCNRPHFPSADRRGNVLLYPIMVQRLLDLLPQDVTIVSGHGIESSWQELQEFHDMLVRTTEVVRSGLAAGKDLATLQAEKVLADYDGYSGSYVSTDAWIKYLVEAFQRKNEPLKKVVYDPLYYTLKAEGPQAAVAKFDELKRGHADEYEINDTELVVVGYVLMKKNDYRNAIPFLEAGLREYPEGTYNWLAAYELALAHKELGDKQAAIHDCKRALELRTEFEDATALLKELEGDGD
jgi:cyclase